MYDRDTYVIHKERPGLVGALLVDSRDWRPDNFVLTMWEDEEGRVEVCYSRIKYLQPFDWRECLECGYANQCRPGYWNCHECETKLTGYKGWTLTPSMQHDPVEPKEEAK